jgi:3-methyladenine DNA glycosylase AlkD
MVRFAIDAPSAIGVSMTDMKAVAKKVGKSHELAAALWREGWYEARMLATLVDDPKEVSLEQMESWAADFDNWAICDTACFCLFDRTPYAWIKVDDWAGREEEFVKRAAFALLASLTVHDKKAPDKPFLRGLEHVERAAADERNFVKKSVNWALRSIGKRSPALHAASLEVAGRLAASKEAAPRWVGKDALRELKGDSVGRRIAAKQAK